MNAHDLNTGTSTARLGQKLFQFALVADTHVNESERKSTSPFATNALANGRARYVLQSIARRDPAPSFVLHLGDIVHPVPELPTFEAAVDAFKDLSAALRCPLHLVPGNHDVGDKRVDWMPAGTVTSSHIGKYRRLFGPDYFAFDQGGCRFIALNAQLLNSGLDEEALQRDWLEEALAASRGKRLFLFSHYPPYVSEPDEAGSYDNIDEPARGWLLGLMRSSGAEAFFAGHVHNFWYDRVGTCEMYLLPATSFMRHDYAELFRVAPDAEFGRDDTGKFGYFLVDVHERGHVAHFVSSEGRSLEPGRTLPASTCGLPLVHTRSAGLAALGVDLRHPWAEMVEIAATGGVQEFERKLARNDYPALALWGMGVRRLRVPARDLLDARVRARMTLFREVGHEFLVYAYGVPGAELCRLLAVHRGLVSALEIVLPHVAIEAALPTFARIREASGVEVYVSKLRLHEDAKFDGSKFSHFINHGFVPAETHQLEPLAAAASRTGAANGIALRMARRERPWSFMRRADGLAATLRTRLLVHVRLAGESPSDAMNDDMANACRVAEAALAATVHPRVDAFVDTFMDVDRGYFPRTGFVDRRCSPRLAGKVYANLQAVLAMIAGASAMAPLPPGEASTTVVGAVAGERTLVLLLPEDEGLEAHLAFADAHPASKTAQVVDLATGACVAGGSGPSLRTTLDRAGLSGSPCAVVLGAAPFVPGA
jgi:hypothetical protein